MPSVTLVIALLMLLAGLVLLLFRGWDIVKDGRRIGLFVVLACIMTLWSHVLIRVAETQPEGISFLRLDVRKDAQSFVIGAKDLIQNELLPGSASPRHIGFTRDPGQSDGDWSVSNVSTTRRLSLRYQETGEDAPLIAPSRVSFNADRFFVRGGDGLLTLSKGRAERVGQVLDATADRLTLNIDGTDHVFEVAGTGAFLLDGSPLGNLEECEEHSGFGRYSARFSRFLRSLRTRVSALMGGGENRVAQFGSPRLCVSGTQFIVPSRHTVLGQLALVHVKPVGFALVQEGDQPFFAERGGDKISLSAVHQPMLRSFGETAYQLESIVAGHTRYGINYLPEEETLAAFSLLPDENPHRVTLWSGLCNPLRLQDDLQVPFASRCSDRAFPSAGTRWMENVPVVELLTSTSLLRFAGVFLGVLILLLLFLPRAVWGTRHVFRLVGAMLRLERVGTPNPVRTRNFTFVWNCVFASAGLTFILAGWVHYTSSGNVDLVPLAPWPALAAWTAALLTAVFARGSRILDGLALIFWTILLAFGHIGLTALALSFEETRYLRFSNDTNRVLMMSAGLLMISSQLSPAFIRTVLTSLTVRLRGERALTRLLTKLPLGLWLFASLMLVLLGLWVLLGTETGIAGGFQPSELVKTLYALALGVMLTLTLDRYRGASWRERATAMFRQRVSPLHFKSLMLAVAIVAVVVWWTGGGLLAAVAGMTVAVSVLVVVNPFWRSFFFIGGILVLLLIAPIIRADMSPALILTVTTLMTFAFTVFLQLFVQTSDKWAMDNHVQQLFRNIPVRAGRLARTWYESLQARILALRAKGGTFLIKPTLWLILFPLVTGAALYLNTGDVLRNYQENRRFLMERLGSSLDVPFKRVISWLEFNGIADNAGGLVAIEFTDTALQVDRSRDAISAARCNGLADVLQTPQQPPTRDAGLLSQIVQEGTDASFKGGRYVSAKVRSGFWPRSCDEAANVATARGTARTIPAIQSDFVGTWLAAFYGRDGILFIGVVQWLTVSIFLIAAVRIIRWRPGQPWVRPAATAAAYTCIAFGVMLAIQWSISWANAFGLIPVMGQPATFLSHGMSHGVLFGTPAMLFLLMALRMRATFDTPAAIDLRASGEQWPRLSRPTALLSWTRRRVLPAGA